MRLRTSARTAELLYSANGMLATDSLQTATLRLNDRAQKKLGRLAGNCGVDVIDELGCVSGSRLHADTLRKTYGRSLRYNLQSTAYMKPQETWGRMAAKILCGDFLQLPPVPAEASLMAPTKGQSYEYLQAGSSSPTSSTSWTSCRCSDLRTLCW